MRRRVRLNLLVLGGVAAVGMLKACGYIALPGGWIINTPVFSADPLPGTALQQRMKLPPGFAIDVYATGIPDARMLLFTPRGDLLVSSPRQGKVWLVERDPTGSGRAAGQRVLLETLEQPHGLAYGDGWLYIAEGSAIARVRFDPQQGTVSGAPERIVTGLPKGGNHWTRTVHLGPDGKLYVTVGSSCNVCIEDDPRRAAMLRIDADGRNEEIYATGLRNAVDFAWQPGTGALYATDNGRDLLGDDFPPCELDRVVQGGFYGWPFANGNRVPDPDVGAGHEGQIAASIPPAHGFGAHTAPLGIAFYEPVPGGVANFPDAYRGAAFVALHGSWNRTRKSGYEVVALHFGADDTIREEPFLTGFEIDEEVTGRPVDVAVGADGALYVSDDRTGSIYRVAYGQAAAPATTAAPPTPADRHPLADLSRAELDAARAHGAALWDANACATCHDRRRAAAEAYRPLQALASKYTLESLAVYLAAPQPPMPIYSFNEAERRDLSVYLLATYP